jgi:hypothetical protein
MIGKLYVFLGFIMNLSFFEPKYGAKRDFLLVWSVAGIAESIVFALVLLGLTRAGAEPVQEVVPNSIFGSPLSLVFFAPWWEELVFRSWVVDKWYYLFAGIVLSGIIVLQFLGSWSFSAEGTVWPVIVLLFLGVFTARFKFLSPVKMSRALVVAGILSTWAFALVHVFDRDGWERFSHAQMLLSVLPQLVAGFFFWVGRVRVGLLGSMALHASANLTPALVGLFGPIGLLQGMAFFAAYLVVLRRARKWEPVSKVDA